MYLINNIFWWFREGLAAFIPHGFISLSPNNILVRLVSICEVKTMPHYWALQDAKAHLSELVKKAQKYGPQFISVRGDPAVVVISQEEYQALVTPAISVIDFFRNSPLRGLHLDLSRDKSVNRDIDL
jgi:antitoxin Phd